MIIILLNILTTITVLIFTAILITTVVINAIIVIYLFIFIFNVTNNFQRCLTILLTDWSHTFFFLQVVDYYYY